jgi:transposase
MAGEVLSGPERRRRWGAEEKARLVAEAMVPGAKVTEIARQHGISRSLLYTWRRDVEREAAGSGGSATLPNLVPVMIADARDVPKASAGPAKLTGVIEIVLPGEVRVTVRGRIEERTLRAVLGALRSV